MFKPDDSEMSPESLNKASHLVKNIITEVRRSLDFNISESKAEEKDSSMLTPLLKKENTMTTHFLKKDPAVCEEVARLDTCLDTSYKSLSSLFRVKIKTLGSIIDREKCYFEQSEGELDEDELASIAVSKDLFFESDFKQELGLEMIVLLDLSGSMSGTRIEQQKTLSIALADAFSRVKGLKAKFYGHTTKSSGDYLEVLNIIDFNGKDRLFKLNSQRAASNNLDGFAIDFVSKKFDKRAKSKLLVVISDGQPAATNYSGLDAIAHVRSKVLMLEKQEIQVLSVSLASSYNAAQGQMYNNIIPFCSFKQTVQDISKWINTQFSKYSKTINF